MYRFKQFWKNASKYVRAFFLVAVVFLALGMGTLGSLSGTGNSYVLKKDAPVVFRLEGDGEQKSLYHVYVNVGTAYVQIGENAKLNLKRRTGTSGSFTNVTSGDVSIGNLYSADGKATHNADFNWFELCDLTDSPRSVTSISYYQLTATSCNLLVNEVVFVADNGTVIKATVDRLETNKVNAEAASAMVDRQSVPVLAQSSFFCYSQAEAYTLMTVSETFRGGEFSEGSIYHIDASYSAFGTDLIALSYLIFGASPFGLRVLPMLASFGVLVVGFLLIRKLTASDKAGLLFGILYALCGGSLTFGHLGTPFMLGVFFLVLSAYLVHRFYAEGMDEANVRSALPLVFGGLSAAAAMCVNGVFTLPVLGIVGLFALGMLRQQTAKRYFLSKAEGEEAVSAVKAEYRYKNRAAISLFSVALVVGALFISIISILPAYFTYVKAFDNPASPTMPLFVLMWKSFAGGFGGGNLLSPTQSGWNYLYRLFTGSGDWRAVTLGTVGAVSALCALVGVLFALARLVLVLVRKESGKDTRRLVRSLAIPFVGFALSVVGASFPASTLIFLFAAYVFAFMLASSGMVAVGEQSKPVKIVFRIVTVLLIAQFLVMLPFVLSIPLPAAWLAV